MKWLKIRPDVEGAAPEPHIKSVKENQYWRLLRCVKRASPKPLLHWQDSSGNILPAEEPEVTKRETSYDVTLQTTVNKTDTYRCVATQKEIYHQIYAETHVYISGGSPEPTFTIVKQTQHWALLECKVQGASPKLNLYWKDNSGNVLHQANLKAMKTPGSYDVILQVNVTKTDFYHCIATQDEINQQISTKTHVYIADGLGAGTSSTSIVALCLALTVFLR